MTGTTRHPPRTAGELLFEEAAPEDRKKVIGGVLADRRTAQSALQDHRRLVTSALQSIDTEIGAVLEGLLELSLGDMLVSCWRKYRALTDAATRTVDAPDAEEIVVLASHHITSTYHPYIDLWVDNYKIETLQFDLTLEFDVTGLAAVVRRGDLVALRGGDIDATATLTLGEAELAHRQGHLDPELVVDLHPSIHLVDEIETEKPLPPTPTGSGSSALDPGVPA